MLLKSGPIGMQIHGAAGVFDYKDIKVEGGSEGEQADHGEVKAEERLMS